MLTHGPHALGADGHVDDAELVRPALMRAGEVCRIVMNANYLALTAWLAVSSAAPSRLRMWYRKSFRVVDIANNMLRDHQEVNRQALS